VSFGFYSPKFSLKDELTEEFLGFQHREPIYELKKSPFLFGFRFFNDCEKGATPRELIILYQRKEESDPTKRELAKFKYKGIVEFIPTRWELWAPKEIEALVERLDCLGIGYHTLIRIEYYIDLAMRPCLPGWSIAFSKKCARSTSPERPVEGGYREGILKGGRGSEGKTYPKTEKWFAHRLEVVFGRHKLRNKTWGCETLGQALRLDPFTVLCREGHFIAVRDSDWPRIIRKPNKCKRIMRGFRKRGPVWVCRSPNKRELKWFHSLSKKEQRKHFSLTTKAERKRFHKLKVKLAVHETVLAPGEIDEGSNE
jgi:hypothetical protein